MPEFNYRLKVKAGLTGIAVMDDVLDEKAWGTWSSNLCLDDGSMYYTER